MRVTDMKLAETEGNIKAFFKVETEDGFLLDGFKIMNGKNGLFVSSPSRKAGERFIETVTMPKDLKTALSRTALDEFQKLGSGQSPRAEQGPVDDGPTRKDDLPF